MHFCKAIIAVGGDERNTAVRHEYSPVSWPEIEVLRLIHGENSVTEVVPFVKVEQTPKAERDRLAEIYGDSVCANAWGGRSSPSEMEAPKAKLTSGVVWINPLTGQTETTGKVEESEPEPPFGPGPEKRK